MKDFFMSIVASATMEFESLKGFLWYLYYKHRYRRIK